MTGLIIYLINKMLNIKIKYSFIQGMIGVLRRVNETTANQTELTLE